MSDHFIKEMIILFVNEIGKCDLPELIVEITSKLLDSKNKLLFPDNGEYQFQLIDFLSMSTETRNEFIIDKISEVIYNKDVSTILYVLPNSNYKKRIIIFPKGTKLQIGESIS